MFIGAHRMYHRVMLIGYIIATLKDSSATLAAYMHTNSSFIGKFHLLCSSGCIGRFIALGSSAVHRVIKITKTDKVRELHISWLTVKANISFRSLWQSAGTQRVGRSTRSVRRVGRSTMQAP